MKNSVVDMVYTKKSLTRLRNKNKLLGIDYNYNLDKLLTWHFLIALFLFLLVGFLKRDILIAVIITAGYFMGAEYIFFDLRLRKRAKILEKDSLFYFQILALILESGSNLKGAIELTCQNLDNTLAREFKKVLEDVDLGKSLTEALDDLKLRVPSDTVNNIVLNLLESNIYGNNMIESLNNQLDYLNDKLILETKARINKMPIKISIASVLLFIPLILIIIIGPIIISLLG